MKKAFTLVELSIVLVIIGLLTAGVVGGQSLIKSAEIQSIIKDTNSYKTAMEAFKLEYDSFPGDMNNATDYWGTASGGCPAGARTGTQTCNGNKDGAIIGGQEEFLAWQHLSNAGIISGKYTGIAGASNSSDHDVGINCPESKRKSVGYTIYYLPNQDTSSSYLYPGVYGNTLTIGKASIYQAVDAGLTPKEARTLDLKVDDGMPGKGFIVSQHSGNTPDCAVGTATQSNTATYKLTHTTDSCGLYYREFSK